MKLEDMMNHYNMNDDAIVPAERLSSEEKERILRMTLNKAGLAPSANASQSAASRTRTASRSERSERSPGRGRRKYWTTAIACVMVLAMATVSFAAIALDKNFFRFFGIGDPNGAQAEMLENLASAIGKEVSDNGTTLYVREAVGDGNSINVLFDLVAPKGTVLDKDYYSFSTAMIDLPGAMPGGAGYYFEQLADDNPKDNQLTFMLCYSTDRNLSGKTMRFQFQNLMTPKSFEETLAIDALPPRSEPGTPGDEYDYNKQVLSGSWNVEFPLDYKDSSTMVKSDAEVSIAGEVCKITEVRYSPISATMQIQGDALKKLDEGIIGTTATEMEIILKDGSKVATNGTATSINDDVMTITCQFSQLVSPADIASINYAGTTILVNK